MNQVDGSGVGEGGGGGGGGFTPTKDEAPPVNVTEEPAAESALKNVSPPSTRVEVSPKYTDAPECLLPE